MTLISKGKKMGKLELSNTALRKKIKKLKIETIFADLFPYNDVREEAIAGYYGEIIKPIFKQPGCYKKGKELWVELDSEFAFKYDGDMFDYYLNRLKFKERPLRDCEYNAIKELLKSNKKLVNRNTFSLYKSYKDTKKSLQNRKKWFSINKKITKKDTK